MENLTDLVPPLTLLSLLDTCSGSVLQLTLLTLLTLLTPELMTRSPLAGSDRLESDPDL